MAKISKADEKLLRLAKDRYSEGTEAWRDNRDAAESDFLMLDGQQWDEQALVEREGRPCLVINKLSGVQKQITGDQRQNRPSIKIQPVDSESDPDVAEIFTGLIRNIEQNSDAESAYDTAFEQCSGGGFGFFRINTEYAQEDAFDQDIKIERILDPFSVTFDPYAKKQDKSDARYVFVEETITKEEFEELYPNDCPVDWESEYVDDDSRWYTKENIRIAEYWYKEEYEKLIYQLETGEVVNAADVDEFMQEEGDVKFLVDAQTQQPIRIVKERKAVCDRVKWVKMTGHAVLEKADWIGKYIPIVGVWGDERWVSGTMVYKSAIRDAKDAQKIYNWMRSTSVETVSQAPRMPYMVTPEQIDGHEDQWASMHRTPQPYLVYNETQMGMPQRLGGSIPDVGAQNEAMISADDIQSTTGLFNASLGQQSNETSGRAILMRQREGDVATFVFIDNLTRALNYAGRIIVDLIPKVYDTERVVRVLGMDGAEDFAEVNKVVMTPQGPQVINDLARGKYDVVVTTGPSYSTQRVEAADAMMQFAQMNPSFGQYFTDLIAKNLDWPGAEEIEKRAQKLLPPGLLERDMDDLTPEEQQQMQAQQQQAQQQQQLQQMQIQMGIQAQQLDLKTKEVELVKIQAETAQKQADAIKKAKDAEGSDLDNTLTEIEIQQKMGALPEKEVN
jgi:hypothetical protein